MITRSLCPVCLKEIPAEITLTDKVMMHKECACGSWDAMVEKRSDIYNLLKRAPLAGHNSITYLDVTNDCNKDCDYCYHDYAPRDEEISREHIESAVRNIKTEVIELTGGEPTVRDDLFVILKYIRDNNKYPIILTNGLKLADHSYVKAIKDAQCGVSLTYHDDSVFPAIENLMSVGMRGACGISIAVEDFDDLDDKLARIYEYKLLLNRVFIRGRVPKDISSVNLYLSDLITYFHGRYQVENIDFHYHTNIYYAYINYRGLLVRLECWPTIYNIDTTELQCLPRYYPENEHVLLTTIKRIAKQGRGVVKCIQ